MVKVSNFCALCTFFHLFPGKIQSFSPLSFRPPKKLMLVRPLAPLKILATGLPSPLSIRGGGYSDFWWGIRMSVFEHIFLFYAGSYNPHRFSIIRVLYDAVFCIFGTNVWVLVPSIHINQTNHHQISMWRHYDVIYVNSKKRKNGTNLFFYLKKS